MTDNSREIRRFSLCIIVGLFLGLAIGIGLGPRARGFVINNGWPKESIRWVTISFTFAAVILNGILRHGYRNVDRLKSVIHPTPPAES
jgi:hypothetical protein